MSHLYEKIVRPALFKKDAEKAHDQAVSSLHCLSKFPFLVSLVDRMTGDASYQKPVSLFGLEFPNAVGMAAGMDKNAMFWKAAHCLGFGHVEVGTITRYEQPGNPQPRMFRYPDHGAIVNRMGFNNDGAEKVAKRLERDNGYQRKIPLGINIGKSKVTPIAEAVEDYLFSFKQLHPYADYFTINVSSPNTPALRELQGKEHLEELLSALEEANRAAPVQRPILLKIAPDLSYRELDEIVETALACKISGLVATNTTVARPGVLTDAEKGGLSGRPLQAKSLQIVSYLCRLLDGKLPVVGVGGIVDESSAGRMIDAGASLVQLYSGFVYGGPFFPKRIAAALSHQFDNFVKG